MCHKLSVLKKPSGIIADSRRALKALSNIALFTDFGVSFFTNFTPTCEGKRSMAVVVCLSVRQVSFIASARFWKQIYFLTFLGSHSIWCTNVIWS